MTTLEGRPGFDLRMTAEEINSLPVAAYTGAVHVVRTQEALEKAAHCLREEAVLGFDTETKPNFIRGGKNPPAIVQFAGASAVYVIQLRHMASCACLLPLLSDERVIKAGVDIAHDIAKLREHIGGEYAGFADIHLMAKKEGLKNFSLRGLAAVLLGVRIPKGMRVSNWARETLLPAQVRYAATDAWISRELYLRLEKSAGGQVA